MAFTGAIIKCLQEDLSIGRYSDVRLIASDGASFQAHLVVLCSQSPFFEKAMKRGRFKEGKENTVHFVDKDGPMIYTMLVYLYFGIFAYPRPDASILEKIMFEIDLWALADEYMIDSLTNYVASMFNSAMTNGPAVRVVKSAFPYLAQAVYDKTPSTDKMLRPIFVRMAMDNVLEFLEQEEFRQLMKDVPDFVIDLTEALGNKVE